MTLTVFIQTCGKNIRTFTVEGKNIIECFSALQSNEHHATTIIDYIDRVNDELDKRLLDNMLQQEIENIYLDVMYDIANQVRYTLNIED